MSFFGVVTIVLLVLIVVPIPLVWILGSIFPDGNMEKHAKRISVYVKREWMRILFCGVCIILLFIFARENVLQIVLVGAALFIGRAVAVGRNK